MKLNIGSGDKAVEGYINIDYSPNVLLSRIPALKAVLKGLGVLKPEHMKAWDSRIRYKDARKLRFPPQSFELIYSSHFLEHVHYWEAQKVLDDCFRFLEIGGVIRLALPNYLEISQNFVNSYQKAPLESSWNFNRSLLSYPFEKSERVAFFLNSRFGHVHRWHPTPAMVEEMLKRAGFTDPQLHSYQSGPYPDLGEIEHRSDGTFYIQAEKK